MTNRARAAGAAHATTTSDREDDLYLEWLYGEVANVRTRSRSRTYWRLLRQMYKTEFIWWVPNDDNRCEDGKDLRYEFLDACGVQTVDNEWLSMGCSMLEMLVALARAAAFETEGMSHEWFWQFIENLGLEAFTDARYNARAEQHVQNVLDAIIWRLYSHDGAGGLFPLRNPPHDQREVELWYQLNAYLVEHE
jgi:hypothetical protein